MGPQLIVNSLSAACTVFLFAVGFAVVYEVTRFLHFGHGVVFTAAAYFVFGFRVWLGLPLFLSVPFSVALCALLGCSLEVTVYSRVRRRGAPSHVLLLASLGVYIVLQNIISMVFGDDIKSIRSGIVKEGMNFLGARITPAQVLTLCTAALLVAAVGLFFKKTKMGRAMCAVANDPALASVSGIDSDRVALWAFAIGSALAGIAGILVALDVDMTPTMGLRALMMGIVAVIIGGAGSIPGIALGALLLGTAQQFGVWKIGSQWQDAIAFGILLAFLLLRPQGFLGREVRKATV